MSSEVTRNALSGQIQTVKRLTCKQCGAEFEARNRNAVKHPKSFCRSACRLAWHAERYRKGAALLKDKKEPRRCGPSKHAQAVSRVVFQSLVPVDQRAELIRQACANLGITDETAIQEALRKNGCAVGLVRREDGIMVEA